MKKALITGITGQDGSYLAEFLLEKGYEVHGITRRASISNTARIDHLIEKNAVTLHDGDLSDSSSLIRIVGEVYPDEIYNLAAQSHVQVSFDVPEYSGDVDALGVLRILEAVRILNLTKKTKVYQASTSELYGKVEEVPQKETTPFHPYSPYAVAKQYGYVDTFDQEIMYAEKSWGSYQVIDVEDESMTIKVTLNPGHRMNYHSHELRDEVWTIVSGKGRTIVDGIEQSVTAGDVVTMKAGVRHTVIADTELQIIEVQLGREINVDDKQKFQLDD